MSFPLNLILNIRVSPTPPIDSKQGACLRSRPLSSMYNVVCESTATDLTDLIFEFLICQDHVREMGGVDTSRLSRLRLQMLRLHPPMRRRGSRRVGAP